MAQSQQEKTAYKNAYAAAHYDQVRLSTAKADCIPARLDAAITAGKATSRQAYIIAAIKKQLDADGIPAPTTSTAPTEAVND